MKKKFPKKAKLITFGGFYKIISLPKFLARINHPMMTKLTVNSVEFTMADTIVHNIKFDFWGVRGGYAEYHQVDFVRIEHKKYD